MTAALAMEFMPYGASELHRAARPHMARALAASSVLGSLALALAWSLSLLIHPAVPGRPVVSVPFDLLPPLPPVAIVEPPPRVEPAQPANAVAAVPVPVPETQVPVDHTIMSQQDLGSVAPQSTAPSGALTVTPPVDQVENRPGTVPFVDKLPEPIRRVEPQYPDLAWQAQVEGLVVVHVLVGKDGRVVDVQLHPKTHVPMLDQAALEAARRWSFEPALVNGHPVSVWVAVPFRFKLR